MTELADVMLPNLALHRVRTAPSLSQRPRALGPRERADPSDLRPERLKVLVRERLEGLLRLLHERLAV